MHRFYRGMFVGLCTLLACVVFLSWNAAHAQPQDQAAKSDGASAAKAPTDKKDAHDDQGKHGGGHHDQYDLSHANAGPNLNKPEEFKSDLAIYTFVVFMLLLALLTKFAWGPISQGLAKRE